MIYKMPSHSWVSSHYHLQALHWGVLGVDGKHWSDSWYFSLKGGGGGGGEGKKELIKFKGEKFPAVPQSKSVVSEALTSKQEMYVVIVGFYYYMLPLFSIFIRFN